MMLVPAFVLASLGAWQESLRALREQKQHAHSPVDLLPSYRAAITGAGRAGKWKLALELLGSLKADGIEADLLCYSEAMACCRKQGKWAISLRLLQDLRATGAPPDAYTTSNAIAACAAGGR